MYMWPEEIKQIIAEVLHAKNPIVCLKNFKHYEPANKITFLLFDGNQTTNFRSMIHNYNLSKYSIVNLGNYANTAIVTTSMLLDAKKYNIQKYLVPDKAIGKVNKETRYKNFYHDNLSSGNSMINDISVVVANIKQYLSLRHEETAVEFEDDTDE